MRYISVQSLLPETVERLRLILEEDLLHGEGEEQFADLINALDSEDEVRLVINE